MAPAAIYGIPAGVNEAFRERLCHILKVAEVCVVAFAFSGQQGMKRMMKVVIPLGVKPVSTQLGGPDNARVFEGAFGDYVHPPIQFPTSLVDAFGELFKEI